MENILTFEVCLGYNIQPTPTSEWTLVISQIPRPSDVHNYLIDYRDPTLKMYLSSAKYQQNTGPF